MKKQVYIAWVSFQRRPDAMQDRFGYQLAHFPPPFQSKKLKPVGYVVQCFRTITYLLREKPAVVWFQMPPNFIAHLMVAYKHIFNRKVLLVADCHNAALRVPWANVPFTSWMLGKADVVLAHNSEVCSQAKRDGICGENVRVLETRPTVFTEEYGGGSPYSDRFPYALVPCSFNSDEPIGDLFDAAALCPEITFVVTGNINKAESQGWVRKRPANVIFSGFLSKADYNLALRGASFVVGLTKEEGIQLSVANEATGAGKAMVLSDTKILRDLFFLGAVFVKNDGVSIAAGCKKALGVLKQLEEQAKELRIQRESRWQEQAESVVGLLSRAV